MNKILVLTFIILLSNLTAAEDKWYVTDPNGFDFYLTTSIEDNKIAGFTRKNALKNIVGWFKYTLVKITTSIKSPEIIHFTGLINERGKIKGQYQYLFNRINFTGELKDNYLELNLELSGGKTKQLQGKKVREIIPQRNYSEIFKQIFTLTEDKLYKQSFLKTKDWNKFKQKMLKHSPKIKDDLELQTAFYAIVRDFPFSHYQLNPKVAKATVVDSDSKFAKLTEVDAKTVILDIDSFTGTAEAMEELLGQIELQNYKNLIIDLRDNSGGNFISAYPLAQYLISQPSIAGVFPNQKWYKKFDRAPKKDEYPKFSEFSGGTMQHWLKSASEKYGTYLKVYPTKKHYQGKVFILTNNRTASTCEPLVYALKEAKIATIIGERTAGAMLSMNQFAIDDDIMLGIPLNDYITYSGDRIDKVGVTPNIKVDTDKALDYTLSHINHAR